MYGVAGEARTPCGGESRPEKEGIGWATFTNQEHNKERVSFMTRKLVKLLLFDYNKDHVLNWTEQLYASWCLAVHLWEGTDCGVGADFVQNSSLATYRPDLMHLPTTSGEHCTGEGIKMSEALVASRLIWSRFRSIPQAS